MRNKTIKYYHPVLRRKASNVEINKETKDLIKEMKAVLSKEDGVGLAAPQIGESKKIIIINSEEEIFAFINPEIVDISEDKIINKEGCISVPEIRLDVSRSRKVKIRTLNEGGKDIEIEAEGVLAIILQHEIDHLNGILFFDRVNFFIKYKSIFLYFTRKVLEKAKQMFKILPSYEYFK